EVPHLVAADEHEIIVGHGCWIAEFERLLARDLVDGRQKLACLIGVRSGVAGRRAFRQQWLQSASPLRAGGFPACVIEEHCIVASCAEAHVEAAGLPIGAIIDASMKSK